ncbi:DUF1254 domain-containing protein [Lutimonas halocynthiae]|uniref:DUF1254 domain-containing protein n=1 Tax=Lutimonas halocynthiae TaxID=1446477 RepID=UPI0025B50991|nr:DUF1254 domain-containing protein [Lutimonas halocynthiae]MDN3642941.1 DUF1254 domain-containing protein [Lutimonas halocynthiae]
MKKATALFSKLIGILVIGLLITACETKEQLGPEEAKEIAKEAYVYGFPIVMNYKTLYNYVLNDKSAEYKGQMNQIVCEARLFTPEDKTIVTPNSDTPYCMFWVDIKDEPRVISVPEMEPDRFYHFQLVDVFTHNFAYLGTLTTGNKAGNYMVVSQGWEGEKPEGITEVITCETDLFFVVVRTQLMGEDDLDNVKTIQDVYKVQGLSSFLGKTPVVAERNETVLAWQDGDELTTAMFPYLDYMLNLTEPIASESEIRARMAKLGIGTKEGFDINRFDAATQKAIEEGVAAGYQEMDDFKNAITHDPLASAKIFGTRSFLTKSARENYNSDNFYVMRAVAALMGLYGNSGEEAIYPTYLVDASGVPFDAASNKYTMTFEKDALPPVNAFWSLSMYDGTTQLFIDNSLDRYLLNSNSLDSFVFGEDGSLTLYVQKESPGKELEPNWLPAPDGPFYCVMRLYGPKETALSGEWVNPPLEIVK